MDLHKRKPERIFLRQKEKMKSLKMKITEVDRSGKDEGVEMVKRSRSGNMS